MRNKLVSPSRRRIPQSALGRHITHAQVRIAMGRYMSSSTMPLLSWGSGPHLVHGSLDQHELAHQTASPSIQPFLHSLPVCPTQRQTKPTLPTASVAMGRIYALHASDAALKCMFRIYVD